MMDNHTYPHACSFNYLWRLTCLPWNKTPLADWGKATPSMVKSAKQKLKRAYRTAEGGERACNTCRQQNAECHKIKNQHAIHRRVHVCGHLRLCNGLNPICRVCLLVTELDIKDFSEMEDKSQKLLRAVFQVHLAILSQNLAHSRGSQISRSAWAS